jgi:NAD(P)H-dependent flavin oxidoreductase YrpB (nitropropane dioxygenase family)
MTEVAPQEDPRIIQGGMGVWVSNHRLARAVAQTGELGVVSGTALDSVYVRLLQDGDRGALLAIEKFPDQEISASIIGRYYNPGGRESKPYRLAPKWLIEPGTERGKRDLRDLQRLAVATTFAEVSRAKLSHGGPIGINVMRKVGLPIPSTIYGAMLAGVDYVTAGAGSPEEIPKLLDDLVRHHEGKLGVKVLRAKSKKEHYTRFDPVSIGGIDTSSPLRRPKLLAIVASVDLARKLANNPATRPDGFIIEGPSAGGHSAPPRGAWRPQTQPKYDGRDEVDLEAIAGLGLPFWLAGSYGSPEGLTRALDAGAQGIQAGTIFALTKESGLADDIKQEVLGKIAAGTIEPVSDGSASPTAFPFKVSDIEGTVSEAEIIDARVRRCDLGYLRQPTDNGGKIDYLCPAEPETTYARKGGRHEQTVGRLCLCNALMAAAGLPQTRRDGYVEPAIFTGGADVEAVRMLAPNGEPYSARDAVNFIRGS